MAKNDFGNFLGGLLNAVQSSYVSERDKSREQERALRDEARQEAILSLQRLQNKQRVNEFNKSFEFQQNQTNVENVRNADKIKFDKLVAQKEMYKQYAPIESMPKSTDGFVFNQAVPGTIDDEFTKQSGSDVLANDKQYYDTNAYQNAYSMYLDKLRTDAYANQVGGNSNKGRIAVVHKPSGTIKFLKENEYFDKVDQGYYPTDTWVPMSVDQASTLGMSQMGFDKSGKILNPTSTPGQVADVYQSAISNADMDWFAKQFTNQTDQTMELQDILNRLKPSGLKKIEDLNFRGGMWGGQGIQPQDVRDLKKFNNQKWSAQKDSNTQGINGFIQNVINPLKEAINFSNTWKDTPTGRQQRQAMELQIADLEKPLQIAYQSIDAGLVNPSVKSDVYNALQFARGFAKKNAVTLELMRRNMVNQGQIKQEIKSLTDK
jgi:hypothetical protein